MSGIWVSKLADLSDTRDTRFRAARMIEKNRVPDAHLVTHEIARLIVAHAVPIYGLIGKSRQIIDRNVRRLGLHQPVAHVSELK